MAMVRVSIAPKKPEPHLFCPERPNVPKSPLEPSDARWPHLFRAENGVDRILNTFGARFGSVRLDLFALTNLFNNLD